MTEFFGQIVVRMVFDRIVCSLRWFWDENSWRS